MEAQDSSLDIPRPELIKKLMGYISEAQKTPLTELCKTGDYAHNKLTFPQTKGEYLEYEMLNLLLDQSWIDGESEPVIDEMISELGQLDMSVNKPRVWLALFELAKEVQ
jgi:hypothetical protein